MGNTICNFVAKEIDRVLDGHQRLVGGRLDAQGFGRRAGAGHVRVCSVARVREPVRVELSSDKPLL